MLKIEIPTTPVNMGTDDAAGPVLADFLREVANQVEGIRIVPNEGDEDWTPEVYRHATRVKGTLLGATITLEA